MARMIPIVKAKEEFNGSYGEEAVYYSLQKLPDEYVVFHSVNWSKKDYTGYVRWGESDFTVYSPCRGILTIEVKSGGIYCKDNKFIQENKKTGQKHEINPLRQAVRCKHTFKDILEEKLNDNIWIEAAVWFTSVDKENVIGNYPLDYHDEIVLLKKDLNNPEEAINRVFDFYHMRKHNDFDPEIAKNVIEILSPQFSAIPNISNLAEEQDFYFNRMTREQSYLLDYLEEQKNAAIQGGAGTGKTMLAIEKAKRLSETEQVLFLCFNRLLIDYLKDKFQDKMPNVHFTNLYALASLALSKEANEEDVCGFLNNYNRYSIWNYKHIIVDEGQDFSEEQINMLYDIASIEEGCFYIFYDRNQLVQQRNSMNWAKSIECRLVLTRNCRNTKCIAETSGMPIDYTNIKMRLEVQGRKPNFYILKTVNEFIENLSKLIRYYIDQGFKKERIVILTCKRIDNSLLANVSSVGPYKFCYNRNEKGILFTTAKKFKGLESDIIIFIDIDSDTFKDAENRRIFYVGSSRAKHYLDFVTVLSDLQEKLLAEQLTGISKKNARTSIMGSLKVKITKID